MRKNGAEIKEKIYLDLRKEIIRGGLRRGQHLVETQIAAGYGINKLHVRDALQALNNDGLVEYRPKRGFFVVGIYKEDLLEFAKIREILERALFEDFLCNAKEEEVETALILTKRKIAFLQAGLKEEAHKETRAFFEKLYECTSYPHIVGILRQYHEYIDLMITRSFESPEDVSKSISNTQLLCRVLEERDQELSQTFVHTRYLNIAHKINNSSSYYSKKDERS